MCDNIDQCTNGADEQFCLFAKSTSVKSKKDAFGRFISEVEGFMYMVIRGRPLLYCGWPKNFDTSEILEEVRYFCLKLSKLLICMTREPL